MATNDFLLFATGVGADVLSQSAYLALAQRSSGLATGVADSATFNKIWRQSAFISSSLAQFVANETGADVLDNADQSGFLTLFSSALTTFNSYLAPLASPSFSGVPVAPTVAGTADSSTKIATTAFVQAVAALKAPLASPSFTGTPNAPTPSTSDDSSRLATTAFVHDLVDGLAPLASPGFTGVPTAPTAASGTNTTQLATTAFVTAGLALKANLASPAFTGAPTSTTTGSSDNSTRIATTAFVQNVVSPLAPLASPSFTGTVVVPTRVGGDNSSAAANTRWVQTELADYAPLASPTFSGTPRSTTSGSTDNSTRIATTAFVQNLLNSLPFNAFSAGQFGALASNTTYIFSHNLGTTRPLVAIYLTCTTADAPWSVGDVQVMNMNIDGGANAGFTITADTANRVVVYSGNAGIQVLDPSNSNKSMFLTPGRWTVRVHCAAGAWS